MEGELVVEHIEELALDAADVALAKHAGAQRPVHVLQRRVIAILKGENSHNVSAPDAVQLDRE